MKNKKTERYKKIEENKTPLNYEITAFRGILPSNNGLFSKRKNGLFYWFTWDDNRPGLDELHCHKEVKEKVFEIYSVKRLSDGKEFKLGDKTSYSNGPRFTIDSLLLIENCIMIRNKENGANYGLSTIDFSTDNNILYRTSDGVDLKAGDKLYFVNKEKWGVIAGLAQKTSTFGPKNTFTESWGKRETAEKYILDNKPCLSVKDVLDIAFPGKYDNWRGFEKRNLEHELTEFIKNKRSA